MSLPCILRIKQAIIGPLISDGLSGRRISGQCAVAPPTHCFITPLPKKVIRYLLQTPLCEQHVWRRAGRTPGFWGIPALHNIAPLTQCWYALVNILIAQQPALWSSRLLWLFCQLPHIMTGQKSKSDLFFHQASSHTHRGAHTATSRILKSFLCSHLTPERKDE